MAEQSNDVTKPAPGDFEAGTRIGRYRLDGVVGRGGMGTVYRAFDQETKRDVAIKILKPGLEDQLRRRFLVECEAEAKIRHPHVMPVYDRGKFDGDRLYFVMELVYEPITLTDVVDANMKGLTAQRWPRLRQWASVPRLVQDVFIPICEGVHAANTDYAILHRDLKPDNVLIDVRTRRPYLIDFGICHRRGVEIEGKKLIGTPRFLSPEQARAKVDERTDVWGLGAMLFYILTGRPPIESSSPMRREERAERVRELGVEEEAARKRGDANRAAELAARRTALEDPSLRTVEDMIRDAREGRYGPLPDHAPAAARAIVRKAMAQDPADRYATAGELAEDLRAWVGGRHVQALAEHHATGAAMAAAQRTVRRHVVTALWVLLGLGLGLPLGARLLSGEDEGTLVRVADTLEEVENLGADATRLGGLDADSDAAALEWRMFRERIAGVRSHVHALSPGPDQAKAVETLGALEARSPMPVLVVPGADAERWQTRDMIERDMSNAARLPLEGERTALAPGPYWIESTKQRGRNDRRVPSDKITDPLVRVPVRLPAVLGDAPAEVTLDLGPVPAKIPTGMAWVPPGPPAEGEPDLPGFLIGVVKVTYFEYSQWIDELPEGDRKARLPAKGFVEDRTTPGLYLVESEEWEDRPIVGIRAEDAAAYAAWRAEIDGAPIALPTEAEWRRAAGSALLTPGCEMFFRPVAVCPDGLVVLDRSPYNVEGLLAAPAELTTDGAGNAFLVKGALEGRGAPPSKAAFAAARSVAPGDRIEAGFRLVQHVP